MHAALPPPWVVVAAGACLAGVSFAALPVRNRLLPRWNSAGAAILGLASFFLGALSVFSRDFAYVWQPVPAWVPGRAALAVASGVVMMAAGVGLFAPGASRPAALVLSVNFALWCLLLHLPEVVKAPLVEGNWGGLGEIVTLTVACWMLYDAVGLRRWARTAFGVFVALIGIEHFVYAHATITLVPAGLPARLALVYATGVFHVVAGLAIVSGVRARLAARLWAVMISLFTLMVWLPVVVATPGQRFAWTELLMSSAIAGAGWVLAGSYKSGVAASPAPSAY